LSQGDRYRRLVHRRLLHPAGHGIHARAALRLGAEPGEPLGAAADDRRHAAERLDVVDDRRLPERALDRWERRLDLRPTLLPREGREQAGLLATDVGAGAAVHDDVEALAEQAGV